VVSNDREVWGGKSNIPLNEEMSGSESSSSIPDVSRVTLGDDLCRMVGDLVRMVGDLVRMVGDLVRMVGDLLSTSRKWAGAGCAISLVRYLDDPVSCGPTSVISETFDF
jgi:hypothetical protein